MIRVWMTTNLTFILFSGCGSVGRVLASDTRGYQFESSHWQNFILHIYCQLLKWQKERKKRAGMVLWKTYILFCKMWPKKTTINETEDVVSHRMCTRLIQNSWRVTWDFSLAIVTKVVKVLINILSCSVLCIMQYNFKNGQFLASV